MVAESLLIGCALLVVPPVCVGLLFGSVCWQPVQYSRLGQVVGAAAAWLLMVDWAPSELVWAMVVASLWSLIW